ncbi:MAG: cell division protein FtsA [Patescibacteria group bacterium]|jgi:cell division protein FtsA
MNTIAAIELGSSKIACAVATVNIDHDTSVRITGFSTVPSKGVKRAQIIDIQETVKSLELCLTQAERMAGSRINHAVVITGGPHIASQTSHGIVAVNVQNKEIGEEDVGRAIESAQAISLAANRQIIHVLPKEFIVDGQMGIKNPVGMNGVRLEVDTHIITANATNLSNIQKACSQLGVDVSAYVFSGLAAAYAVVNETEKELGCVVLDIGAGTTELCVYIDGSVAHTASVPLGSKNVTSDIAAGLRISLPSAEKIKLFLGERQNPKSSKLLHKKADDNIDEISIASLALPEKMDSISQKVVVSGIIKPRLEEIAEYIKKELTDYNLKDQVPAGLIATGGGSMTPYLVEVLKKELGVPVRIGMPMELSGISDELHDPSYSPLVGALLYSQEERPSDKPFNIPQLPQFFKNVDFKNNFGKVVDFFKSFVPGSK